MTRRPAPLAALGCALILLAGCTGPTAPAIPAPDPATPQASADLDLLLQQLESNSGNTFVLGTPAGITPLPVERPAGNSALSDDA